MKKACLFVLLIVFSSCLVYSQDWTGQGRQIGYVFNEQGNPLEGVTVKLFLLKTQSGFELTTNKEGKWVAIGVKGGTWHIDFFLSGYLPKKMSITILDYKRKNNPIRVQLEKAEGLVLSDEMKQAFIKGNNLFEEEKYEESIGVFNEILANFPGTYVINLNIGNCYFKMERYDEAEKFYSNVYEKDPKNIDALMGIGNCHVNRGDNEKALEWYNKIEFEKIQNATVLYNIGTIFYSNSKYDEALKYYRKAVEIKEDFLDACYQLGLAYLTLGNNQAALSEFEHYLKQDSESERATQVKGFIEYLKKET